MAPEVIVTLVGVAVIVGALAVYLIIIAGILIKVSSNLTRILNEVIIDVAQKTTNLGSVVSGIASDVSNIERSMSAVASAAGSSAGGEYGGYFEEAGVEEEPEPEPEPQPADEEEPVRRRRRRVRAARA